MSEQQSDKELKDVENALRLLRPASRLGRDQLIYRAGQRSHRGWQWPASTAVMTAVAAGLVVVLLLRPEPLPAKRIVVVHVEKPAQAAPAAEQHRQERWPEKRAAEQHPQEPRWVADQAEEISPPLIQHHPAELWQMQQLVLRWGVESLPLPVASPHGEQPQTLGSLISELAKGKFGKGL